MSQPMKLTHKPFNATSRIKQEPAGMVVEEFRLKFLVAAYSGLRRGVAVY